MTTLTANLQSEHLARRVATGAIKLCVTSEWGKCVVNKSSNFSPSDCVHLPEEATKDPSLILGYLEIALCNLADLGRTLIELQKVLQTFLEAFLTSFPEFLLSPSIEFPTMRIII